MQCGSRCYHRRHGAGSFRRESGSGSRSALAPKSTTPPGPVLGPAHAKVVGVALGRDGRSWAARAPVDIYTCHASPHEGGVVRCGEWTETRIIGPIASH